jgi:predicted DsbA family dithiol-disulfide isomerase
VVDVAPGTVVVYSDVGCPWAHLAVHRLIAARRRLGLEGRVVLDHRAFALEVFNRRPTPKRILDAEIPVVGGAGPDAGWQTWQDEAHRWPVTTLPALEAVQGAKEQGLEASERLDRALRLALFAESRCISLRHVVLEVAENCAGVDADALADALDGGRHRRAVLDQTTAAESDEVSGSPHVFLADGTDVHNPGVEMHWVGEQGTGFPVVTADDPSVYDDLLRRA